ncbi:MAG: hypothetical protein PWP24_1949 [Clostridiales bacterium]|nr:hypothetical protein [Clostridiales bacterium]
MLQMGLFGSTNKIKFIPSLLVEGSNDVRNPGRGWYRIYTFLLQDPFDEESLLFACCKEESLALVLIDIGYYKNSILDEAAIRHLQSILTFFRSQDMEIILRIVYDREGKGMEHEPSGISLIRIHMKQIGLVVREYADVIFTLQGIFVGSWGEMHHSKFLNAPSVTNLMHTLYQETGGSIRMAVRSPRYLRMLFEESEIPLSLKDKKVGLYNDGMMGSETDLGTYDNGNSGEFDWEDAWLPADEFQFIEEIGQYVPIGGEAVGNTSLSDVRAAISYLEKNRVTYLHSIYDPQVIEKWKASVYKGEGVFRGRSAYEYIGARLGYRLVVEKTYLEMKKARVVLNIELVNRGFANPYEDMKLYLQLKKEQDLIAEYQMSIQATTLIPSESVTCSFVLTPFFEKELNVSCFLLRKKDEKQIRVANLGVMDTLLLGKLFNRSTAK